MSTYALKVDALGGLDDDRFLQLCQDNPEVKFERNANGELIVMSPTGGETGRINAEIGLDHGTSDLCQPFQITPLRTVRS